jgi:coproporphyrinogen III oxidase-like Fe-S oxidoreductase
VLSAEDQQIRTLLWTLFAGGAAMLDEVQGSAWWRAAQPALATLRDDGLLQLDARRMAVTQTGRAFLRRIGLAFDRQWAQAATGS